MRKLTVTVKPNLFMKRMMGSIFQKIESVELKELMRLDFANGKKLGVGEITVKSGVDFTKIKTKKFEILDVLDIKENKYICLVKVNVPRAGQKMMQFFDFDLIYDIPTIISSDKLVYSVIGVEKNLKRFLRLLKMLGSVEKVIYKKADYRGVGINKCLTEKQNQIINDAMRWGYYQYPRKIDTKELAKRVGVSRTTLVEHLRKAENRVMDKVFAR